MEQINLIPDRVRGDKVMFTGIVECTAPVLSALSRKGSLAVRIKKPKSWKLKAGQSVAVDGICSTVTKISPSTSSGRKNESFFEVEYMPETIRKTTAGTWKKAKRVNLERPLTLQSFLDGYLVQGHVDESAQVYKVVKSKGEHQITLKISRNLSQYVAARGSVTLNGVSLTVARKKGNLFTVAMIPYTLEATNLGLLKKGDRVNIEVDMVARYLETLMQ